MGIINLLRNVTETFLDENKVKAPTLSRKLELEYSVVNIIIDELELIGIISPFNDGERILLISTMDDFEEKAGNYYRLLFPAAKEELKLEDTSSYNSDEEYEEEISYETEEEKKDETILEVDEIGEHSFQSSVSRGGEVLFPEHIYVNDFEVTWEKKSGVFSKDTKTIPIAEVTQIDVKTTLLSASIIIRSKGYGQIKGEHFAKSDAMKIKRLIELVKSQKR